MSVDLFDRVIKGQIKIEIKQKYALADAVQAHRDLEGRKTVGSSILIP
jgi:NADPH2:quinone reductase